VCQQIIFVCTSVWKERKTNTRERERERETERETETEERFFAEKEELKLMMPKLSI
jgi:hypothetical protein